MDGVVLIRTGSIPGNHWLMLGRDAAMRHGNCVHFMLVSSTIKRFPWNDAAFDSSGGIDEAVGIELQQTGFRPPDVRRAKGLPSLPVLT